MLLLDTYLRSSCLTHATVGISTCVSLRRSQHTTVLASFTSFVKSFAHALSFETHSCEYWLDDSVVADPDKRQRIATTAFPLDDDDFGKLEVFSICVWRQEP